MFSSWSLSLNKQDAEQRARHSLRALLPSRPSWPEAELLAASGLPERTFQSLMLDLLNEGVVRRRQHTSGHRSLLVYQAVSQHAQQLPTGDLLRRLAPEARQILAALSTPNTAVRIAQALDLPLATVREVLSSLHDIQLVTCRYVGMLNIYARAATLS